MYCDICGMLCYARGLKNHIRLKHKLKISEITTQVNKPTTQVIKPVAKARLKSEGSTPLLKSDSTLIIKTSQVIQRITTYVPHTSECDGCGNHLQGVIEQDINGGLRLYLCRKCRKDQKLINRLVREISLKK
jgi:hypothetical protein